MPLIRPYTWSLVGLVFDIVGVLLLSIEAIKIENIQKIRERWLAPLHEWTKPVPIRRVSPQDPDYATATSGGWDFTWWIITHAGSGAVTLYLIFRTSLRIVPAIAVLSANVFSSIGLLWKIVVVLLALPIALFTVIGIGEWWHHLLIWATGRFVAAVDFVDRRTPDGTVGIIGVALAILGFILQFAGTWLSRPS